jgi:GTPase
MEMIPEGAEPPDAGADTARVAIMGRPNVGKSSLLNRLIGEERVIVSDQPGTTRDTVDTLLERDGKRFLFTDTAGLRAKKSKAGSLEGLTRIMSERALDRAGVALLMLDASEPLMEGDVAVARLIEQKQRACVAAINKWDTVEQQEKMTAAHWFRSRQPEDMPFMDHAPLYFVSAKTGLNVPKLLDALWEAHRQYHRRFDDEELAAFFWQQIQDRPYSYHGKKLVFRGAEQAAVAPPTLIVRSNCVEDEVHFSYRRHLENEFRRRYGLEGSPLALRFRRK